MRQVSIITACRKGVLCGTLGLAATLALGTTLLAARLVRAEQNDTIYTLERTYKAGDIDRYKIDFSALLSSPAIGDNVNVSMKLLMKETTQEVKSDGNAILFVEFESAFINLGDNQNDISAFLPTLTQTRSKTGAIVETKTKGATEGPAAVLGQLIQSITDGERGLHPPKPVKIGDTWKIEEKTAKPGESSSMTTGTAQLTGMETVNGVKTMTVKAVTDTVITNIPKAKGGDVANQDLPKEVRIHSDVTGNLDGATGKIARTVGTLTGDGGPTFKIKVDMKVSLVTGKAASAPEKK